MGHQWLFVVAGQLKDNLQFLNGFFADSKVKKQRLQKILVADFDKNLSIRNQASNVQSFA